MVQSFIRGLTRWPTADLAELLVAIKGILDKRAAHHAQGGGIEAEVAKRPKVQRKAAKQPERQQR